MESPKLDYIKEISGGDLKFEQEIVKVMKEEFPQEKENYFTSLEKGDEKSIAEIVHKIKHKFSILGLEKGYETAMEYEENLKKGDYSLKEDFERNLEVVTSYLAQL